MKKNSMTARNVLIVLLHGIGDCLMALPGIEALKQQSPNITITVMTINNTLYHDLFKYNTLIDHLLFSTLLFNPHYGNPLRFFREKRIINKDIQRAVEKYQFTDVYVVKMFLTPAKLYAHLPFPGYKKHKSLRVARELGVTLHGKLRYKITYHAKERAWAALFLRKRNLSAKKMIGLHFTGSAPSKSIPFTVGQRIIDHLKSKGYTLLMFHDKHSYVREEIHYDSKLVTTYISDNILHTAALIDQCQFFVGVDSGLAHIAAALRKKTFVVYIRAIWRQNSLALGNNVRAYTLKKNEREILRELELFLR
jgi:ADP-heptose:LPS heptosyltransferase